MQSVNALYGDGEAPLPRKKPINNTPTEFQEQTRYVKWLKANEILFFAIPNGGSKTVYQRMVHKAEGLIAGIPDILVAEPCGAFHGLFVELKRTRGGVISGEQEIMMAKLKAKGYAVMVAYGCDDAILITNTYLALSHA